MTQVKPGDRNPTNTDLTKGELARRAAYAQEYKDGYEFGGNTETNDHDSVMKSLQSNVDVMKKLKSKGLKVTDLEFLVGNQAFWKDGTLWPNYLTILYRSNHKHKSQ